jgi:hypothetical protein
VRSVHASEQGLTTVFNLEVFARHEFFVGEARVRVHNGYADEAVAGLDLSRWSAGSFASKAESLVYHFRKHGREVGATSISQYLQKALDFADNTQRARRSHVAGAVEGVTRYKKRGKYIDLDRDRNIVSFGSL